MKKKTRCHHCHRSFTPRPQNPLQRFCSQPECQKARKRLWQQHKRQTDPDYRDNQRQAQKRWRQRHRDYWKRYRQHHPDYVKRNRDQQQNRDQRRRVELGGAPPVLAKRDVSTSKIPLPSGTYEIVPYPQAPPCKDGRMAGKNLFIINALA